MIDLKLLRNDPDLIRQSLAKRGQKLKLEPLIDLDQRHRDLLADVENLRAEQNKANKKIAESPADQRQESIIEMRDLSEKLKKVESYLQAVKSDLDRILSSVPNLVHPEVPSGLGEESNVVLRQVGGPVDIEFDPKDHLELGESLDIIDVQRAAKISGSRFAFLKGRGALLELSLARFALDRVNAEGFLPVITPVLVREEAMFGTGFLPAEENEIYRMSSDELFLVGTSEVPLAAMHSKEILNHEDLPLRYAGYSSCFRREAGTYGKDTRGIVRLHQFEKVEMFSFCAPDSSEQEHLAMLSIEEAIFQALEIPYRVVEICAGDLQAAGYRKFDLEAWIPGAKRWLEITSCSNCTDYQARRLGVRSRSADGTELVHTLNGTAIAIGRAIVALLENHQQADGSVVIPQALQPYTGFDTIKA